MTLPIAVTGARVPTRPVTVYERRAGLLVGRSDALAIEEPLEIRLEGPGITGGKETLSITMRTPGHDFELVTGFLLAEGVIEGRSDLSEIAYCVDDDVDVEQRYNIVTAKLIGPPGITSVARHVLTSSACGVCGAATIDAVRLCGHPPIGPGPIIDLDVVLGLPDKLRVGQRGFDKTGGLHGIGLFTPDGDAIALREDVGRHNAVDKVVGWALLDGRLPLSEHVLVVSGRISFEIVQKAVRAGIAVIVAVSAATSLAVALAESEGVTLVGFTRGDRCTVYAGRERLSVH